MRGGRVGFFLCECLECLCERLQILLSSSLFVAALASAVVSLEKNVIHSAYFLNPPLPWVRRMAPFVEGSRNNNQRNSHICATAASVTEIFAFALEPLFFSPLWAALVLRSLSRPRCSGALQFRNSLILEPILLFIPTSLLFGTPTDIASSNSTGPAFVCNHYCALFCTLQSRV